MKEGIVLPWQVPKPEPAVDVPVAQTPSAAQSPDGGEPVIVDASGKTINDVENKASEPPVIETPPYKPRTLHLRHFEKALKEITPSSSESLGTLSALRKWNEEFGEGRTRKRRIMWGKGLFGFGETGKENVQDGRVAVP